MPLPQAVLFDLDGTLIDTAPDFVLVLNTMLARHGKDPLDPASIRAEVSNGARALVQLGFNVTEGEENFPALRQELLDIYLEHLCEESTLFQNMEDTLKYLESNNIPWGIVTNKPSLYTEKLLQGLKLSERCAVFVCPDHVTKTKPDPEPMFLACDKISVDPNAVIYVGDHIRDIEAGQAANMLTVTAAYGYISEDENIENWQADHIIQSPLELINIVNEYA